MSYILDALKRADAERGEQRNTALGAPASPASYLSTTPTPPARRRSGRWGIWLGVALIVLAATGAWQRWKPSVPADAGPTTPLTRPSETLAAPPRPSPPQRPPETPPPERPSAQAPVLPILAKAPPPRPEPPPGAQPPGAGAPKSPLSRPAPPPSDAPTQVAPPTTPEQPALSAAERTALPPIQISGSAYSANQEHRMLIANGQVVKEGQELTPGLTLEVIGPRSAVFNHRGTRFNVNY